MLIIGLTGGIGSGKTTVAKLFAELGITIIDADIIAHELVAVGKRALYDIQQHFGDDIIKEDGALNRPQLRDIIFADPNEKLWLENLLHPRIRQEMKNQVKQAQSAYCIAVIPLLIETQANDWVDRILVVDLPESLQQQRAMERDNLSLEQVTHIMQQQTSRPERLAQADDVVNNALALADLKPAVLKQHTIYLNLAAQHPQEDKS